MRTVEAFLVGAVFGGLLVFAWATMRDTSRQPVAADDTCACCEEFLQHIEQEHPAGAR